LPHPGASPQPVETVEPPEEDKGGTDDYGCDHVEGSQPPTWMIWWGDEVIFFSPEDAAEASLLDAFRSEIDLYANKIDDINDETENRRRSRGSLFWEVLGLIGGGITAVVSCPGVPFTFWAAGGTG